MRVTDDLKPHNRETIRRILDFFKTERKCCAIQATGTGKTFLILRLLEILNDEGKVAVIFAPNREIIKQTKKRMKKFGLNNATFYTYQKLARMTDEELSEIKVDLIVCDELHRTGAKTWGQKFEQLVNLHLDSNVFGVTATPLRCADGRDMAEEYFDGNKACNISLAEALVREIIPVMPIYISALYTFEEEYQNMSDKIDKAKNSNEEKAELQKELLAAKQQLEKSNGVPEIIKKYITNYNGKYIVFCQNRKHLYEMKEVVNKWFREAGYEGEIFEYPYYSNSNKVKGNFEKFKNNSNKGLKLLFVIDKLNEGLHLEEIQGCFLLRTTDSNIIYYQQIGRVFDSGSFEKRIIIDLVCNFNSLKQFNLKDELEKKVKERNSGAFSECIECIELDNFNIVDCVQECVDIFKNIDNKIHVDFERWSNEEDSIIKDYFPKMGAKVIKFLPYRSEKPIYRRAEILGITKNIEWSDEEINLLKKLYPQFTEKCFDQFDYPYNVIRLKVKELGLKSNRFWSDEELDIIKRYYPFSVKKCAELLPNRTVATIRMKAKEMKIKIRKKWSDNEIELLKKYYPIMGSKCVDIFSGRTVPQIVARAASLGLKVNKDIINGETI